MRQLILKVLGSSGTPTADGFDKLNVDSIVDNGVGDYTIIFKKPFNKDNAQDPVAFIQPITADVIAHLVSADHDRVTIACFDATDGTTAKDADVALLVVGCDHRFMV